MKIELTGLAGAQGTLKGIEKRVKGWRKTEPKLHRWLIRRQKDVFRTQGQSEGKKWVGYNTKYKAYKQALVKAGYVRDMSLLRWTGGRERLYPSLTQPSHTMHVFRRVDGGFVFGTRLPYARRLQEGIGKNQFGEPIAARPFAVISEKNQARLAQLLLLYIRNDEQGNGWET